MIWWHSFLIPIQYTVKTVMIFFSFLKRPKSTLICGSIKRRQYLLLIERSYFCNNIDFPQKQYNYFSTNGQSVPTALVEFSYCPPWPFLQQKALDWMSQNYSFFIVYGVPLVHCKSYERTIYDTLILARVSYTLTSCFTSVSQKKKGIEWRISFSINVMMICSALFLLLVPRICVDHVDSSVISDRLTKHSALMWCSLFWKPFSMISHVSHREENIVYESRLHQTKAIVGVQYTER